MLPPSYQALGKSDDSALPPSSGQRAKATNKVRSSDIFISYAREDQKLVASLVATLEQRGRTVFWDRRIPAGQTWRTYIGRTLERARCVVVVWSKHSIKSDWVLEEAEEAKRRNLIIPVRLDTVEPPWGFRSIQAADLSDWKPEQSSLALDLLIVDITKMLARKRRS